MPASIARNAFGKALENTREIEITTVGRTAGLLISQPAWFVRRDDKFYLLPVRGPDSNWYKNLQKGPRPREFCDARGRDGQAGCHALDVPLETPRCAGPPARPSITCRARPITDPAEVEEVVEAFRAKY